MKANKHVADVFAAWNLLLAASLCSAELGGVRGGKGENTGKVAWGVTDIFMACIAGLAPLEKMYCVSGGLFLGIKEYDCASVMILVDFT
ncbi:hypothetical protein OAF44_01455 [Akkermansiaceae bacterium]|nr:hypothetical protein [Akkermansiaceae bacterium]MDB4725170.1 hypothetical protein [Akkermansiaceae bacterium]